MAFNSFNNSKYNCNNKENQYFIYSNIYRSNLSDFINVNPIYFKKRKKYLEIENSIKWKVLLYHPILLLSYIPCFIIAITSKEIKWDKNRTQRKEKKVANTTLLHHLVFFFDLLLSKIQLLLLKPRS